MCRASSDPRGGYRCPKKSSSVRFLGLVRERVPHGTQAQVLDALRTVIGNTAVTAGAEDLDLTEEGVEQLRQIARKEAASVCMDELARHAGREQKALMRDIGAPTRKHIACAIATWIGEVCTLPGKVVGDLATAVGDRVAEQTSSPLAGKLAAAMAGRLMADVVLEATPIGQVKQLGVLADMAGSAERSSTQRGGTGPRLITGGSRSAGPPRRSRRGRRRSRTPRCRAGPASASGSRREPGPRSRPRLVRPAPPEPS